MPVTRYVCAYHCLLLTCCNLIFALIRNHFSQLLSNAIFNVHFAVKIVHCTAMVFSSFVYYFRQCHCVGSKSSKILLIFFPIEQSNYLSTTYCCSRLHFYLYSLLMESMLHKCCGDVKIKKTNLTITIERAHSVNEVYCEWLYERESILQTKSYFDTYYLLKRQDTVNIFTLRDVMKYFWKIFILNEWQWKIDTYFAHIKM